MGYSGWPLVTALIFGILLLVAVAAVAAVLVGSSRPGEHQATPPRAASAAEVELELRYARGEIDAASFVQQRAVLRQG
jgi:uncharacterized membrane protein